jgi:UDP-N-acetylmuramate dehydrogenase
LVSVGTGPGRPHGALDAVAAELSKRFGRRAVLDAPLGARTTYRVGGNAAVLVEVDSEADLRAVHEALLSGEGPVPVLVLGQGSNLLVADSGFHGVVLTLGQSFDWVDLHRTCVRAGGATMLPVLARRAAAAGLRGLEWSVGVPGSVGGALRMNAGGHGSDTAAVLRRYRSLDLATGRTLEAPVERLGFAYRSSALGESEVVVWAEFGVEPGDAAEARAEVAEIVRWRREHQPGGSNAGSVFTNPVGDSAGRLVEESGLKGLRIGTATVSEKHANFIQADQGGSADDVRRLLDHVRGAVERRTGVALRTEVRLVGFPDTPPVLVEAVAAGKDDQPSSERSEPSTSTGAGGRSA